MPLTPATPSEDIPGRNASRHIRTPSRRKPGTPNNSYHPGHHKFVERSYDTHSKLYHPNLYNWHDLYDSQVSYEGSVVTRSQTAFNRTGMNETDTQLFGDKTKHHPPNLPHLVVTMKDGTYGALPRTIVTRSLAEKLETNPILTRTVDVYKEFKTLEEEIQPPKRKSTIFQKLFKKENKPESVLKPSSFTANDESSAESKEREE